MARAVILAGGLGTRLRPYTFVFPKPLMPIGDQPILEVIVRQLSRHGFDHLTLAVNRQANLFRAYFGDGSKWGVTIDYSLEAEPLGTMGPLRLIPNLPENFLVMNGDIMTDLDYAMFFQSHVENARLLTIAVTAREQEIDYGIIHAADGSDFVRGFEEKPRVPYLVSMGIYCMSRLIVDQIPDNIAFGFDQLALSLIDAKRPINIERHKGYWLDIGRPDDYKKALDDWSLGTTTL